MVAFDFLPSPQTLFPPLSPRSRGAESQGVRVGRVDTARRHSTTRGAYIAAYVFGRLRGHPRDRSAEGTVSGDMVGRVDTARLSPLRVQT